MSQPSNPSVGTSDVTGIPPDPDTGPADTTSGPTTDNCCVAHESPGCNEPAVLDCVCAQEATCCAFAWSETCVELAMGECRATCEDPDETTGDDTTTGVGAACTEIIQLEMVPSEATHSGAWELGMSMVGEGEISALNQMLGTDGSILYEPDIPCDDTWYIWVRYWEQGANDSYFAALDGEPVMPQAIFEGDCSQFGNGYSWAALNWREPGSPGCTYLEDPWAPEWTAGTHTIEFSYRESLAMGRILLTNDPDFVP